MTKAEASLRLLRNPARLAAMRIRSSQRWKDCRLVKLRQNPLCEDPRGKHSGCIVIAKEVHHIVPLIEDPSKAYDLANLMSVCVPCHAILSGEERGWIPGFSSRQ
jgi:5-methylcytosine-specific restriction endonuclease McrA